MESHEEKLHNMIKQSKMDSAKDQAARQAKAIKERQREQVQPHPEEDDDDDDDEEKKKEEEEEDSHGVDDDTNDDGDPAPPPCRVRTGVT
jgi:hypothetical protein